MYVTKWAFRKAVDRSTFKGKILVRLSWKYLAYAKPANVAHLRSVMFKFPYLTLQISTNALCETECVNKIVLTRMDPTGIENVSY